MRSITSWLLMALVAVMVTSGNGPSMAGVNYDDFSDTTGLTLNGNAAQVSNVLRIVPAQESQAGSAFTTSTQDISKFSTSFRFRITNSDGVEDASQEIGADGITFTIQGNGPTELGNGGGGLGYETVADSVAIEFDTWNNDPVNFPDASDPDSNHVGVNVGGSVMSVATVSVAPKFDDTSIWYVWIDYNGTTLEVRTNNTGLRPALPTLSININIPAQVGSTDAYLGFTGGTGGGWGDHDLLSWNVNCPPDCSNAEPSIATLWPPNHKFVPIAITGVTDPEGDLVTITIDSIFQDEPVRSTGKGSGNTSPDGAGLGTDTALVRAERNGNPKSPGNGRVYRIDFTANDGKPGGTCRGTVRVCVPHDWSDDACVDDGTVYDSTSVSP